MALAECSSRAKCRENRNGLPLIRPQSLVDTVAEQQAMVEDRDLRRPRGRDHAVDIDTGRHSSRARSHSSRCLSVFAARRGDVNRRQKAEVDVHRREVFLRRRDVTAQRADRRFRRKDHRLFAAKRAHGIDSGNEAGRDILDVALRSGKLAGKEDSRIASGGHRRQQASAAHRCTCCDESGPSRRNSAFSSPGSSGRSASVRRISDGFENRRCCSWTASGLPAEAERRHAAVGPWRDPPGRPVASGRNAACRGRGAPVLRSADRIRNSRPLRIHGSRRSRRKSAPRRSASYSSRSIGQFK